jgi:hypothetical protein
MSGFTQFDYLLKAFEQASKAKRPADHGYQDKRRALYAYVRNLEAIAAAKAEPAEAGCAACGTGER